MNYSVSLRVHHPSADPAAVAAGLGWRPECSWRAGQPRQDGAGRPLHGTYKQSYCTFHLATPRPVSLPAFLDRVLAHLEDRRAQVQALTRGGGRLQLWIALYAVNPAGNELDSTLLGRCGALGVALALSVSPFQSPGHGHEEHANVLKPARSRSSPVG